MKVDKPLNINRFLGTYTSKPSHLIPDFYLANALNISCGSVGLLSPFKGYSDFVSADTPDTVYIVNSVRFRKGDGQQIPLIALEDGSNVKMYWYNPVALALEHLQSLTTATVPSFSGEGYNTSTADGIYWSNGVDNYTAWSGAVGSVSTNDATTITLNAVTGYSDAADLGFAASGTVHVNGTDYTYAALSGWQLTGLTALPTFDANEGVAQAVTTDAAIPKFNYLVVADGRVWGGRNNSIRLYYSAVGDGGNFTAGTNPDDPGYRDFVEGGGVITGLSAIREYIIVGKSDLVRYFKLEYPTSTSRTTVSEVLMQGDNQGPASHFAMVPFRDQVWYLSGKGGVRSVGINQDSSGFVKEDVTEIVRPSLRDAVTTGARGIFFEKERIIRFSYKNNSDSTRNDREILIELVKGDDEVERSAITFSDYTVGGYFIYQDELYFGSSFEGKIFQMFDGYTKANNPFNTIATLKRYNFGSPVNQKTFEYIAVAGFIAPGQLIQFQLSYNNEGSLATFESQLSASETQFMTEVQLNTIGAFAMGTEPIGGTIEDIDEMNIFLVFFRLPEYKPYDVQLTIYGDGTDENGETVGNRWAIEGVYLSPTDAGYKVPANKIKYFTKI